MKARPLPYALKDKVAAELDRLWDNGNLSLVPHAEWATPVVLVTEKDGGICICGDFKATVNTAFDLEQYALPWIEDMFASLKGRYWFSKFELQDGSCHIALDEESRKVCVINMHKGLYCYNCLPYGNASAPALFQQKMESILRDVPGTRLFGRHPCGRGTPEFRQDSPEGAHSIPRKWHPPKDRQLCVWT